jgi:hypothetical protein
MTNIFILTAAMEDLLHVQNSLENKEDLLWSGYPYLSLDLAVEAAYAELLEDYEEMEITTLPPQFSDWTVGLSEPGEGNPSVPYYELFDEETGRTYLIRQYTI